MTVGVANEAPTPIVAPNALLEDNNRNPLLLLTEPDSPIILNFEPLVIFGWYLNPEATRIEIELAKAWVPKAPVNNVAPNSSREVFL